MSRSAAGRVQSLRFGRRMRNGDRPPAAHAFPRPNSAAEQRSALVQAVRWACGRAADWSACVRRGRSGRASNVNLAALHARQMPAPCGRDRDIPAHCRRRGRSKAYRQHRRVKHKSPRRRGLEMKETWVPPEKKCLLPLHKCGVFVEKCAVLIQ